MLESQRKTYQLMLEQLHKIESKYGSINNAPDDDPNLIKLEQLRPKSNYQTLIDEQDEIMKLIDKGYQASDVAQKLGLRRRTISDFFKRHKIQPRPAFTFKIISPDKKVFYAQSLGHFLQVSFHRSCSYSVKQSAVYLKRRNFQINGGYFIWAEETNNWDGMSNTKFGIEIGKRFKKRRSNGTYYLGLDLKTNQQFGFNN